MSFYNYTQDIARFYKCLLIGCESDVAIHNQEIRMLKSLEDKKCTEKMRFYINCMRSKDPTQCVPAHRCDKYRREFYDCLKK